MGKKVCAVCGKKIGLIASRGECKDGYICRSCAKAYGYNLLSVRDLETLASITIDQFKNISKNDILNQSDVTDDNKGYKEKMKLKAVGTSFDNDDGVNRQDVIKKIVKSLRDTYDKYEFYGGLSNADIIEYDEHIEETYELEFDVDLEEYKYNGKPAVYVTWEGMVIGNLPAESVNEYLKNKNLCEEIVAHGYVIGGKCKYADIDDEDNDVVRIEELNYGVYLKIYFLE